MIPGYAIERELGTGAHGKVYLAREESGLTRPVALKVFEDKADFERELAVTRRIEELRRRERVAELVQALGSGEHGARGYIVLEYLESGSLAEVVARSGPLDLARALAFTREVARALGALHRDGLFHRDVKPQNVLLGQDGHARLGDFGLSRSLDGTLSAAGSPAFAAPEVIAGRPSDGRKADVYSLGATLAFLLTGETILPGRPDVFALERRSVPRPLQQAIAGACAADPAERFATVEDLVAALDAKIPEIPRTKPDQPDDSRGGLVMETKVAKPASSPRVSKLALGSFLLSLGVPFLGIIVPNLVVLVAPELKGNLALASAIVASVLVVNALALASGIQARARIRRSGGALAGQGWATAGIAIGVLDLVLLAGLMASVYVIRARGSSAHLELRSNPPR